MNLSETVLEFNKIKEMLCNCALSEYAKQKLCELKPYLDEYECKNKIEETTQAKYIIETFGNPPLCVMKEIEKIITLCEKEYILSPEQLELVSSFIGSCERMKNYLEKTESENIKISYYGKSIYDLSELRNEIDSAIQNSIVQDCASNMLRDIRRKIENINMQIKNKLNDLLRSRKNIFADNYVSQRNGHYVLPVKKEYKNQINGTLIDTSSTGGTYFIEPTVVSKMQNEMSSLKIEEENEVKKILYIITSLVYDSIFAIKVNIEAMITLDIIFAKAKLSLYMNAVPSDISAENNIKIINGRHPLIDKEKCIPLNFSLENGIKGIVITGPNTGGKTVTLKTVGLLSVMAQCGLHVPAEKAEFRMNNLVLCDIGDGQNISENLSTFSAHIKNIINILNTANEESLVLLDELGSGTDPAEGMGIAISILEELKKKNCLFIATTHYPEVKEYAEITEKILNARMAFDRESLKPLYKLEIGKSGESCALYIAKRLGFPNYILERAYKEAYNNKHFSKNKEIEFDLIENDNFYENNKTIKSPKIKKRQINKNVLKDEIKQKFQIGDSVIVYPEKNLGIIFKPVDEKGNAGVQIKGKKLFINYKRIKLKVSASELYPPDYDFSIIFDSVENRKAKHKMDRKYVKDLTIKVEEI